MKNSSSQSLIRLTKEGLFIPDYYNYGIEKEEPEFRIILETKVQGNARNWTSMDKPVRSFITKIVNFVEGITCNPPEQDVFNLMTTLEEEQSVSELERNIMKLIQKNVITEDYAQDLFRQEQIFKDNMKKLLQDPKNKEILVCGNEIFVGISFEQVLQQARTKFPDKPYYSYSTKMESIIL